MQAIEQADFLDQVFALLSAAKGQTGTVALDDAEGMDQGQSVRTFAEVYGRDQNLLMQLATAAQARGDVAMAGLLVALDQGLRDASLSPPEAAKPARRLVNYVYPVV